MCVQDKICSAGAVVVVVVETVVLLRGARSGGAEYRSGVSPQELGSKWGLGDLSMTTEEVTATTPGRTAPGSPIRLRG